MGYDDPKPSDPSVPAAPPPGPVTSAPQDYKTAGIFTMIAGILNVLVGLGLVLSLIWVCIGVIWIAPVAAGVFEIICGAAAMSGKPSPHLKTASIVGLVACVINGNLPGLVLEILSLVWLHKPEVAAYVGSTRA